jgi:hypothetical protein
MGTINHGYINRVKYVLQCEQLNAEITIIEPIGWNSDDKELARNAEYDGIVAKFSNSLKFIDDGAEFIQLAYELYDVIAKVKLTKYELHPKTDREVKTYWGYLDLMTKEWNDGKLAIKFNSGGLQEDIKSRESEDVEVDRTTTIDGTLIDAIAENEVLFQARRIFLKSLWEAKNPDESVYLSVESSAGNTRAQTAGYPIAVVSSSQEQVQSILSGSLASENTGTSGIMFMANFDRTREITVVGSGLSFRPKIIWADWQWAFLKVCLTVYRGSDYILKSRINLKTIENAGLWDNNNKTVIVPDFELKMPPLQEGESVAVEFFIKADLKNFVGTTRKAYFAIDISEIKGALAVEEDSYFEPSKAKFYLFHDLLSQLTTIAGNTKKAFYSDYFGRTDLGYPINGPGAFIGTTHGFAVRGFDKLPIPNPDLNIENLYKPMTTSLKDAIESVKSVLNIGVGIEEVNGKERLRIEEKSYFYNNNVTIKLPNQVKKVKRSVASDYYYPSLEMGYENGGDYEEAQGLDEPNGKSNFTTIINKGKNIFSQLSKYRADSYGKEFARRKPFKKFGTEDTKYDIDVFLLDLKKGNNNLFEERKWQDDFAKAPTGIFSPDTANGLRFSPFNMLLRHSWVIASGLTKYATEKVRYGSSTANSQLKTQLIGGNEYAENGNIINSELGKARFIPEWIEFEHECSFEIMQMVQGTTIIQGKKIQNFYGTVEFTNERNQIEKGFLFNLKPNGKGSWKLLKSNR